MKSTGLKRIIYILALPLLGAWLIVFAEFGELWPFSDIPVELDGQTPWSAFRKNFFGLAVVAFAIVDLPNFLGWNDRAKRLGSHSNEDTNNG